MKKTANILLLAGAALLLSARVSAQGPEDLLRFSQYNWSYGTARSAAMGGAFSSLGADLSSMMLNPAGLGMYRRSEIGFSPSFTSLAIKNNNVNDLDGGWINNSSNRNRFALNNIGAAFNVYNSSGGVTSVTFGFAYNKLIDHNTNMEVRGLSGGSMADMFVEQLNFNRVDPGRVEGYLNDGAYAGILGALMSFESGLTEYDDALGVYHVANTLGPDSRLNSYLHKQTTGSTGQYDISLGMNVSNILYLGLGFGLQDIYYKETSDYSETANNNLTGQGYLEGFSYNTFLKQTGSSWNFKLGAIIRPVEELRIGLAFHTPTYINIDEQYYADMYTKLYGYNEGHSGSKDFRSSYNLRTPMRFIGGISYTFFNTAILSIDYERVWYNQMKLFWNGWDSEDTDVTREVKDVYKPANNLRAGLEVNVAPNWFTRVGVAYYDSMYKDGTLLSESAFDRYDGRTVNYSGGFGYRTGTWGIDLAYIYMDRKEQGRVFNYWNDETELWTSSAAYKNDRQRHNVTATLSWRF